MDKVKISRTSTRPLLFKWEDATHKYEYYLFQTSESVWRWNKQRFNLWKACYRGTKLVNPIGVGCDIKFDAGFYLKQ